MDELEIEKGYATFHRKLNRILRQKDVRAFKAHVAAHPMQAGSPIAWASTMNWPRSRCTKPYLSALRSETSIPRPYNGSRNRASNLPDRGRKREEERGGTGNLLWR